MSEMAGPWLNLPLMLVSGTGDLKDIKVENNTDLSIPEPKSAGRRRSFYNMFLGGRQDAVDDSLVSPSANRKGMELTYILCVCGCSAHSNLIFLSRVASVNLYHPFLPLCPSPLTNVILFIVH